MYVRARNKRQDGQQQQQTKQKIGPTCICRLVVDTYQHGLVVRPSADGGWAVARYLPHVQDATAPGPLDTSLPTALAVPCLASCCACSRCCSVARALIPFHPLPVGAFPYLFQLLVLVGVAGTTTNPLPTSQRITHPTNIRPTPQGLNLARAVSSARSTGRSIGLGDHVRHGRIGVLPVHLFSLRHGEHDLFLRYKSNRMNRIIETNTNRNQRADVDRGSDDYDDATATSYEWYPSARPHRYAVEHHRPPGPPDHRTLSRPDDRRRPDARTKYVSISSFIQSSFIALQHNMFECTRSTTGTTS